MNTAILTPAWGRDYKNAKDAIRAFNNDAGFINETITDRWVGKPCNRADLIKYSEYTHVQIRFNSMADQTLVKIER